MTNHRQPTDPISIERLEKAVTALAYIVMRHGEQYGPLLEWLADELEARQRAPTARDRAQQILNRSMRQASHAV